MFLISLKAGGVGLNLTEADYVFLLDPWWNPAVEDAGDRPRPPDRADPAGHRLPAGRARRRSRRRWSRSPSRKAELFSGVMDDGDLFAGSITAEDIRGLLDEPAPERRGQAGKALAAAA